MKELLHKILKGIADWKTTVPGAVLAGFVVVAQQLGWTQVAAGAPDILAALGYVVSTVLIFVNTKPAA